ncbi:MAG: YrdB family protein [Thermoleophilia bacterium]
MSQSPAALGLHFVVEILALIAVGAWGWTRHDGLLRLVLGIGLPILLAAVWAVFRAAGDGPAPIVTVPGPVRLVLEVVLLGAGVVALWAAGWTIPAVGLGVLVVVDLVLQLDRVGRLLGSSG